MSLIRDYIGRRLTSGWHKRRLARRSARGDGSPVLARLLNDKRMLVPPGDFVGKRVLWEGAYEYETVHMVECLARRLGRHGVLLDVGANLGSHTLFFADIFETVHAFEPNPPTLALLRRNVDINHEFGIRVHGFGLSSEDGAHDFVSELGAKDNLGSSAFVAPGEAVSRASIKLPVRAGDAVLADENVGRVDAVKIDVEGHEIDVLRGLERTIRRDRPIIVFEFHPDLLERRGGAREIRRLLDRYQLYVPSRSSRMRGHGRLLKAWLFGPCFALERGANLERSHRAVFAVPQGAIAGDPDRIDLNSQD